MKIKSNLIKILILCIIMFLFIGTNQAIAAGGTVYVENLYDTCTIDGKECEVYCVQIGKHMEAADYTIGNKYEVDGEKVYLNGTELAKGTDEALKRAYILASNDTVKNVSEATIQQKIFNGKTLDAAQKSSIKRLIKTSVYSLTSIKQNAIWQLIGKVPLGYEKYKRFGYWISNTVLKTKWNVGDDAGTYFLVEQTGSDYHFVGATSDGAFSGGVYDGNFAGITDISIGDGTDYYEAAETLYNKAINYKPSTQEVKLDGNVDDIAIDYTADDEYIVVGPIKLQHSSSVTVGNAKIYNKEGILINGADVIGIKEETSNGTEITIKIKKSSSIRSVGKVLVEYTTPNIAKATWYELNSSDSQNLIAGYGNFEGGSGSLEVNINKDLIPPIKTKLKKIDADGNVMKNVKFIVMYPDGTTKSVTSDEMGYVEIPEYIPTTLESGKILVIEEKESGYRDINIAGGTHFLEINYKYDKNKGEFVLTPGGYYINFENWKSDGYVNVVNEAIIEKFTITKQDSKTGQALNGAKFTITLENVSALTGYSSTGSSKIILKDVNTQKYVEFMDGVLKLETLQIADQTKPIKITIEESQAPLGYKKLDGKIILTLQRVDESGNVVENKALRELKLVDVKVEGNINPKKEFDPKKDVELENHAISLYIKNIPVMNIGGYVWEDSFVDGKIVKPGDELHQTNEGLGGVKVYLVKGTPKFDQNNKLLIDQNEIVADTMTLTEGKYIQFDNPMTGETNKLACWLWQGAYLFPVVEKPDNYDNYNVVFEYNGMTYCTVTPGTGKDHSKANEIYREAFNKKFKNINNSGALQEDGNYINLEYETLNGKSKLITKDDTGNILDKYIMSAVAKNTEGDWKNTWKLSDDGKNVNINLNSDALNLNCGLNTRYFDLALGLDVEQAFVTINGKTTNYTYEQILTAQEIDKANNFDQTNLPHNFDQSKDLPYLFLRLDKEGNLYKDVNEQDVKYNLYLYESDYNYRIDDYKTGLTNNSNPDDATTVKNNRNNSDINKALDVYVMYKTIIYNQSSENGYATKLINYVPEHYEFVGAEIEKGTEIEELPTLQEGQNVIINLTNDDGNLINQTEGLSQEITLYYKIAKDQETGDLKLGELENNVEIYEYYTEKGIVDYDSAPGNKLQTEDDIDTALPLNVQINEQERIITGKVFEDTDQDGIINNENPAVNDVIVQLIEIKELQDPFTGTTQEYEYIWQETTSGVGGSLKKVSIGGNGIIGRDELLEESKDKLPALDFNNDDVFSKEEAEEYIRLLNAYVIDEEIEEFDFNNDGIIDVNDTNGIEMWLSEGPVSTKDGMYVFAGFIPGNYIVRFIYGDGTTYDLTQNQMDYNGQDYKSTYLTGTTEGEQNYMREWYNNTTYGDLNTKATDNPNRRLEVMGYSKVIDGAKGTALETLNKKYNELTDKEKENLKIYASIPQTEELTEEKYNEILKDVLQNTWMCAETAKINVPISSTTAQNAGNISEYTEVGYNNGTNIKFTDISLGLTERPKTSLELTKHITKVVISDNMGDIKLDFEYDIDTDKVNIIEKDYGNIEKHGYSTRANRGNIAYSLGVDEITLLNSGTLKTEYTYIVKNNSEEDYYKQGVIDGSLSGKIARNQLSQFYYTGVKAADDKEVKIKVEAEGIQEVVNPKFNKLIPDDEYAANYYYYNVDGVEKTLDELVSNPDKKVDIIENSNALSVLLPGEESREFTATSEGKINAGAILADKPENANYEGKYDSYIAQIVKYSIPSGRKCENSVPGNLSYVHSMDETKTMETHELDEFWGETFMITAATGEDKQTPIQIAIIIVSSVAIIGVGIILIKKFVLKK